jgi:hypothetical protein
MKDNNLNADLYLLDIDAGIKMDNPDLALIEEGLRIANYDPAILLRNLATKIQKFEVSRLNNIRTGEVVDDIIGMHKEAEGKYIKNSGITRIHAY